MAQQLVHGCPSTMGDDYPLNTTTLIRHTARSHGEQEIVWRERDGSWQRYDYARCYERVCRGANALKALGVQPGDAVGILDWNNREHFELYWSIPGIAAVMLQLNLRLTADQLAYVMNHSQAKFIVVDETLLPVAEAVADLVPSIRGWIVISDKPLDQIQTRLAPLHHYEDLLAAASPEIDWPLIDEKSAYSACYTTGTTGKPKGVYYSHRSIYLHAMATICNYGSSLDDCTMLLTPMFHASCWGTPQAATLGANKIVPPGRYTMDDMEMITEAAIREGVTMMPGAPVLFQPMLDTIRAKGLHPDWSRMRMPCGATEPPVALMRGFLEETGAEIIHAYGATETSPLVTANLLKPSVRAALDEDARWDLKRKQGLPVTGVDVEIRDELGKPVPADGKTSGELCLRGPWITASYHDMPAEDMATRFTEDGYWRSGDRATIDANGYVKIVDRTKDVIKSGGEWISSIDMENALMALPQVLEAAVIGVPHPKWQERPVAIVARRPGTELSADQVRAHLGKTFAKWQVPDKVVFVEHIARTSVGKANKKVMRAQYVGLYSVAKA